MFARTRDPGAWVDLTTLPGTELESFDAKIALAIDGGAGGAYEPSGLLTIGGAGLEVAGAGLTVSAGSFHVGAGVTSFLDTLVVDTNFQTVGISDFQGTAAFHAAVTMSQSLAVDGDASFAANIVAGGFFIGHLGGFNALACVAGNGFTGSGQFDGNLNTNGTFSALGDTTLYGNVTVRNDHGGLTDFVCLAGADFHNLISLTGQGRIKYRVAVTSLTGASAGQGETYAATDTDIVMVGGDGAITGPSPVSWKITSAGASDGCVMTVSRELDTGAFDVYVVRDDNSMIVNLDRTNQTSAVLIFQGGTWKRLYSMRSVL